MYTTYTYMYVYIYIYIYPKRSVRLLPPVPLDSCAQNKAVREKQATVFETSIWKMSPAS